MRRPILLLAALAATLPAAEPLRTRTVSTTTGIDPDGAEKVVRWGRFDGGSYELGGGVGSGQTVDVPAGATMPRMLAAATGTATGGAMTLHLPARTGAHWLRIRCAYAAADPAIVVQLGGETVFAERLLYEPENPNWSRPVEINRSIFLQPGAASTLTIRNTGSAPVYFDAIQLERRAGNAVSPVLIGSYCSFNATLAWKQGSGWGGAAYVAPPAVSSHGAVRVDTRFHLLGAPGASDRWAGLDYLYGRYARDFAAAPLHFSAFGSTPEWMADPASLAIATSKNRPFIAVPDRAKFTIAVGEWLDRYGSRCAAIELMNEVDIEQFWIGTWDQYATLCNDIIPLIREKAPQARIFSAGLSMQKEGVLDAMVSSGMAGKLDWVANHCYAGESSAWDIPNGTFEGHCLARGIAKPIFANEQGFVHTNAEWFQSGWTPQRQHDAINRAMARLTAAGQSRVLFFHAGGDDHPYALCDATGAPRPAYQVLLDYDRLNAADAKRLDVQMIADGGDPQLRGVYCIASQSAALRRIVAVLNPSQALTATTVRLRVPLPDATSRSVTTWDGAATRQVPATLVTRDGASWLEAVLAVPRRTILSIVPDTTAPRVGLTAPAAGVVSGMVSLAADASDDVGVAGVRFRLDGADLGAEDAAAPYTATWDSSRATPGSHVLAAVARDAAGNTTTSATVTVTVPAIAPAITAQPASLVVAQGAPAAFSVTATGTGPLSYAWKRGSTPVGGSSPTLSIASAQAGDAGSYTVTISNAGGSTTSAAAALAVDLPGHGWAASYYGTIAFGGARVARTDPRIDFAWGAGAPAEGIGADGFSVRWRGLLTPATGGAYVFHSTSDDGVRLWVDGRLLIDQWHGQGPTTWTGGAELVAGRPVLVVLEYLEYGGGASARLEWSGPGIARQVIPQPLLTPAPGDDLPGGFAVSDIGTAIAGSASESGGIWTVAGSGSDIWGTSDGFRLVARRVSGDVRITARVSALTATEAWAKAGVMLRADATAGSVHAFACATRGQGLAFQRRSVAGGSSAHTAGPFAAAPWWVRLERIGGTVVASASPDGTTWTELRRERLVLPDEILAGMAVTSHRDGSVATATFASLEIVVAPGSAN